MHLSRQISSASDETLGIIRTVSARWVFLPPNAIPLTLTEKRNMKKVKELIQDIKKIGGLEDCGIGGLDCGIEITQSKILQSSNGKGGAE